HCLSAGEAVGEGSRTGRWRAPRSGLTTNGMRQMSAVREQRWPEPVCHALPSLQQSLSSRVRQRPKEESIMRKSLRREFLRGTLWARVWGGTDGWAQKVTSPAPAQGKLERLTIAVAPIGYDTNFTWLNPRSGNLDKRPALEFLVGINRHTGAYMPELA